jgi:hypothetical protein
MKQKLLLFLLLLTSLATYAYDSDIFYYPPEGMEIESNYDFESDGIYYFITSKDDKTVEVTFRKFTFGKPSEVYFERLTIPKEVSFSRIGYTVSSVGGWAFYYCESLETIGLPKSIKSIGDMAFGWCFSLKAVISDNPEPPALGSEVFAGCPIATVYVPDEAVEAYQAADGWKEFNIVGIGTLGVEDAVFGGDAVESATVYTLQGLRVKGVSKLDDVKSLNPGLYIVNGKKVFVK